ncbi:unnamed protein product [Orchesella dallaii]|uniref:Uncharacterized protein n=1 Tax=Orchesella dallaii TaxID=48710 RepID=A0ABP1RTS2_9HEXA
MTSQNEMDKGKEISLNSDAIVAGPITANKREDEFRDKTPGQLYAEIVKMIKQPNTTFQFTEVRCMRVGFGSYAKASYTSGIPVIFTELGIVLCFPHSSWSNTMVGICIPFNTISDILVLWKIENPFLFVSVTPQIAEWVRQVLGMNGDPENGTGKYFSPDSEYQRQKMILLELTSESGAAKDSIAKLQAIYEDKLIEISFAASRTLLVSMIPSELHEAVINDEVRAVLQ